MHHRWWHKCSTVSRFMPDNPKRKRCSSTDRRWRSAIVCDVTGDIVNCFGFAITWMWFELFVTSFALEPFVKHLHFCLAKTLLPCKWATKTSYQCKWVATMLFYAVLCCCTMLIKMPKRHCVQSERPKHYYSVNEMLKCYHVNRMPKSI